MRRRSFRLLAPAALFVAILLAAPLFAQPADTEPPDYKPIDLAHVASVVGAPRGPVLAGEALEAEAKRVSSVLRCPVCQGLSVSDSPSTMATHMRQEVRELVAAGFVEEQVLAYFEASYGEFVRLEPALRGVNWLVWLAPAAGLALGLAIVLWVLRGARASSGAAIVETGVSDSLEDPAPERDDLPEDPELARAVLRVRATAYGWPGGRRPEAG